MKEGSVLNYRHKSGENTHSHFFSLPRFLFHSHSFFFTEPILKFIALIMAEWRHYQSKVGHNCSLTMKNKDSEVEKVYLQTDKRWNVFLSYSREARVIEKFLNRFSIVISLLTLWLNQHSLSIRRLFLLSSDFNWAFSIDKIRKRVQGKRLSLIDHQSKKRGNAINLIN